MKNWKIIILFVVIIIFTFSGIVVSGFWKDKSTIKHVELTGNVTLSKDEIFEFAKLNDSLIYSGGLSLEIIESRISKHPNIKKVVVSKDAMTVKIDISEKNPFAVVSNGNEMFLVDNELTIYNLKKEHNDLDLPVITGMSKELSTSTFGKEDLTDLKIAQYIISSAVKINKSLYNYISEINFTDPEKLVLVTSDDATPVYFIDYSTIVKKERSETTESVKDIYNTSLRTIIDNKLVQLDGFLKQVRVYKPSGSFKYIDMRYNDIVIVKYNNSDVSEVNEIKSNLTKNNLN